MTVDHLTHVRTLVRQLSLQEKLYLLQDLTTQVIQQATPGTLGGTPAPLPRLHLDHWPDDLPLRREELYDDRGR
jgi:hypothetical protein